MRQVLLGVCAATLVSTGLVSTGLVTTAVRADAEDMSWTSEFDLSSCTLSTVGRNPYFILEPGFQLVLEDGGSTLHVTVLDETEVVDGIETRVVEEREWEDGALYEISRNYFAMCKETADMFYFGEHVDFYEGREVVGHDGSWVAGKNGAKAGLIMPAQPKLGMRYYQEQAPDIAMDRAEVVSVSDICDTPAGTFSACLKMREGSALEPTVEEYKFYARDIGLIQDEDLRLVRYGFVEK